MYIGQDLLELFKHIAQKYGLQIMTASAGLVTSVDPVKVMAKVMLEPLGVETGWLPIGSVYAGAGFGLLALPDLSTEVTVVFEMGDLNVGRVILCNWNDTDAPPGGLSPGEVLLLHKTGSLMRFNNDGSVELDPNTVLKLAGGGAAIARVGDPVQATGTDPQGGTVTVTGTITGGSSKVQSG